jgi:hypothetical protein
MSKLAQGETVNSTIDWATFTSRTKHGQAILYGAFNDMVPHLDDDPREWEWMGYRGLTGPGLACGSRDDGSILRASGSWSNDIVWALPRKQDIRPSRVDLQVTVRMDQYIPDVAEQMYANTDEYSKGRKRVPTFALTQSSDGGQTLYAGKRTSPRMVRVYDKFAESKFDDTWENCWRFEVELKRKWAESWWTGICNSDYGLNDTPSLVHRHCEDLCVPALFCPGGDASMTFTSARASTDAGTLEWLRVQVAPAVARLIDKGEGERVINALFPSLYTMGKAYSLLEVEVSKRGGMGNEECEEVRKCVS